MRRPQHIDGRRKIIGPGIGNEGRLRTQPTFDVFQRIICTEYKYSPLLNVPSVLLVTWQHERINCSTVATCRMKYYLIMQIVVVCATICMAHSMIERQIHGASIQS